MTKDTKRAEDVLHPGQYFRLQTVIQDVPVEFSGRLQEIACRYLAVMLDIETADFLGSMQNVVGCPNVVNS